MNKDMIATDLEIYVFSYNRPAYLENCLASILRHASNFSITVVDDDSPNSEVDLVLSKYKKLIRIIKRSDISNVNISRDRASSSYKVGGLYANMNWAIRDAGERNIKYVCFIQDDQQFVRPLRSIDLQRISEYFNENIGTFELHTCFLKGSLRKHDTGRMVLAPSGHAYHRCLIPDDHISPRRSALFMARSVLRDIRDGARTC